MYYQFWIPFLLLSFAVVFCERRWCMLRDLTQPKPQPYSWSRVQLAWWTVIVLSSFIAVMWKGFLKDGSTLYIAPELDKSAIILLGISGLTSIAARSLDANNNGGQAQHGSGESFFLDILSDHSGISISRFQTVVFNFVFGLWFIRDVLANLGDPTLFPNKVIPVITDNNLVLLGLSSATYAALKITENQEKKNKEAAAAASPSPAAPAADAHLDIEPAVG
ncbi:hypothetical protein [Flaviaesturariibacter amylovorans]|uniref:Uncharacterized protein n=1 Tax=Flaviaesturariibacter amylovorans TaxID=1084520 RepID=A0ABP8HNG5_9BACT